MRAETKYAKSGDVHIAYQVVGEGPRDLILVPGWISHLELQWEDGSVARFLDRLASFSRLIVFDKRGTGLSDRVANNVLPTLEERMDDVRAVMDAVNCERAALFGVSEGGCMAALFAATFPSRTSALIMYGAYARRIRDDTYPWGMTLSASEEKSVQYERLWGTPGFGMSMFAPSVEHDEGFCQWWARYSRAAASPAAAVALYQMNKEVDIRHVHSAFEGIQPTFRQVPPKVLYFSIMATFFPN